jgi:MFS family permease
MSKTINPHTGQELSAARQRLRTPRAAAVAGILFTVLFTTFIVLIRLTLPESLTGATTATWLQGNESVISFALTLVPFAGIAFLWFIGVVRDRLGNREDQFLSTVFMGSGLLFLAMMFVAAAIAGGIVTSYNIAADVLVENGVITFGRAVMYSITNVYAIRMAGVFMISSGTLWIRTGAMPRALAFLTYGLALVLLVTPTFSLWLILAFPTWVLIISIFILVRKPLDESEPVAGNESTQ